MRTRRARLGPTVALVAVAALLAGCAGGSGTDANSPGGAGSPTIPPLHVVGVHPHKLTGTSPLTVQFASALSQTSPLPTLTPAVPGTWARQGTNAVFTPSSAYPPSTTVAVHVAKIAGGRPHTVASRTTPAGSLLAAQEILARLHYLPLTTKAPTPVSNAAERTTVYNPPPAGFKWRYSNVPSVLRADWAPNRTGQVLRGAVIAFQHQAKLPLDGVIGPKTWRALIAADLANKHDPDSYSYVFANLYLPQKLSVWVAGKTVLTSPVNGGVPGAPTPLGTYPVYERFTSTTMAGTNPDGTKYKDPGVPWVNYFSGGSAVHGFPRASYGSPQSVGCLELPIATAQRVFALINYGTLVTVSGPLTPPPVATPSAPASSKPAKPTHHPSATASPTAKPSHSKKPAHGG